MYKGISMLSPLGYDRAVACLGIGNVIIHLFCETAFHINRVIVQMNNLSDELRYRLLKKLEQNPNMTQREFAEEMGMSLGKVNYCLKALVEKGWIKVGNFRRNKYKLRYVYLLTPKGLEEKARVTVSFLKRKQKEYDMLKEELAALQKEAMQLKMTNSMVRETE